jgi:hypothetical protein
VISAGVLYVLTKTGKLAELYTLIKGLDYFPINALVRIIAGKTKGAEIHYLENEKSKYLCMSNPNMFQKIKHTGIFNEHIQQGIVAGETLEGVEFRCLKILNVVKKQKSKGK